VYIVVKYIIGFSAERPRSPMRTVTALLLAAASSIAAAQSDIDRLSDQVESQVIAWRRHLHQNPELAYQEVKTAAYIADALRKMPGIDVHTGVARTGVKAVLKGGRPGPVIALRADMDALPVEERNDLPFRSQATAMWQGKETPVMHACGHDTHVAMLLGAADILSRMRDELPGTVVFIFQPAEEGGMGAFRMVREGVLDNPKVEAVFGQHISAAAPGGTLAYRAGGMMASGDSFSVTIKGVGGHGASPWQTRDPIVTAAHAVVALQSVVSRQADLSQGAAVVTVGQIAGGNRTNIIPETATFSGTIRTLNEATRTQVHEGVVRTVEGIAAASGLTAEVTIRRGTPILVNDPALTAQSLGALRRAAGSDRVTEAPASLATEDFGAYAQKAKVFYWRLYAPVDDSKTAPNHSPLFMIGEQHLKTGVKAMVNVALDYLGAGATK
jgi:amidohydrolase